QKGTGRARAGMTSSPLWRGGGKIFPNSPDENFSHKVNRKMYRAGLCSILSQLAREDRVRVVDDFRVAQPKTKLLAQKVRSMGFVLAPVVSEKSTFVADKNRQYVFRVADQATKPQIKAAVELMFKTKVDSVTVSNVKGKPRRFGRIEGRRRNWKKAYVRLAAGQEIN